MEAVYWGNASNNAQGGMNHGGAGKGPWVMADLEKGLWGANTTTSGAAPVVHEFVVAALKGRPGGFALKGGDAQKGPLTTLYEGERPSTKVAPGPYNPMKKQVSYGRGGPASRHLGVCLCLFCLCAFIRLCLCSSVALGLYICGICLSVSSLACTIC